MCQARSLAPSQPRGIPRPPTAAVGTPSTHGPRFPRGVRRRTRDRGWGHGSGPDGVAGGGPASGPPPSTQPGQKPCARRGVVGCCQGRGQWGRTPNQGVGFGDATPGMSNLGCRTQRCQLGPGTLELFGVGCGLSGAQALARSESLPRSWACPAVPLPQGCRHPCPGCGHPHALHPQGLSRQGDPPGCPHCQSKTAPPPGSPGANVLLQRSPGDCCFLIALMK